MHYNNEPKHTVNDGDTCTVYRPEYQRHELWVWDRNLFSRDCAGGGWQYVAQGTREECDKEAEQYA